MIYSDCIVCGSDDNCFWDKKNNVAIVQCNVCDFVWANPRPSDEDIAEYYNNYSVLRNEISKDITNKRKIQYIVDRDFIYNMYIGKKNIKTLDFGCHDGLFLNTFDERFIKHGVEICKESVEWARSNMKFGKNIHACDILDAPYKNKSFDLIIMRGVIEHLTYPDRCMKKISELLCEGGLLYILATPNINSFVGRMFGSRWGQVIPPEHLLYFSDYTLERYLYKFEFDMVSKYFPYIETPYANIESDITEIKNASSPKKPDGAVNVPFYNNMMSAVFCKKDEFMV